MLLRKIRIENVRSFLDQAALELDGNISILVGPNGGGKTNLLDIAVTIVRRYLFSSMFAQPNPTPEQPNRFAFQYNDALNNMLLERHSNGAGRSQLVEVEVEVTARDLANMTKMKDESNELMARVKDKYVNHRVGRASEWDLTNLAESARFIYRWTGNLEDTEGPASVFLEYLQDYEVNNFLRAEYGLEQLSLPMIYLSVNRSVHGFSSGVQLARYNDFDYKRHLDASLSRTPGSIVPLAIGRLAQKFRLLLEKDSGRAREFFKSDSGVQQLTRALRDLGYEWRLISSNPLTNEYDIQIIKQGSAFNAAAASSGERELLTYLFAIYALNVRDALIVVDEPELHLHPSWQKKLLQLFVDLSGNTGNQFLLATHSPTFVSPDSIQYISRVYSHEQQSRIVRLAPERLPGTKHLLNIVNSQNNESLFFADEVILVEGLSDRIFFEAVLDKFGRGTIYKRTLEVISVGGKGLFASYVKLLKACSVPFSIIADRDYIEEIGSPAVGGLFKVDCDEIKDDVLDNSKSLDGAALVGRIEDALATESWDDARNVWAYIKSRHRQLRANLSSDEQTSLSDFIAAKRSEKIYVLKLGALEEYLPAGYRSKDIGKLVDFLSTPDFWQALPPVARAELEEIAGLTMPQQSTAEVSAGPPQEQGMQ